ncbi:hypothetical protein GW950_02000 [Candidatus Wolfebacteria bacterium]|nr:hypothetical protein [Candidatus Wolfebacteria bacterium]
MDELNDKPPDFRVEYLSWRSVDSSDFKVIDISGPDTHYYIGKINFFTNIKTGALGYDITSPEGKIMTIVWHTKLYFRGEEKTLSYVAYYEDNKWMVRRAESIVVVAQLIRDKENNPFVINFYYDAIIGGKGEFYVDI